MVRYLVGDSNDTWDFYQAYDEANDGDILEFKEGFYLNLMGKAFCIDKNLTLEGHIVFENNTNYYTNKIIGSLRIIKGADVYINNLWLESDNKYDNIINVKGSSNLCLNKVIIDRTNCAEISSDEDKYPEIFVSEDSNLTLNEVSSFDKEIFYSELFAKNSKVNIINSDLFFRLYFAYCNVSIKDSTIKKFYTNTINSKNSSLNIENSTIEGGDVEKNYPSLYIYNSILDSKANKFIQENFTDSLYLTFNSYLTSSLDEISSINLDSSRAFLSESSVNEIIILGNKSYLIANNCLKLMGKNNEKIDLLIDDYSFLRSDEISFSRYFNPNIRISNNSILLADKFSISGSYDLDDVSLINIEKSDDSFYRLGFYENNLENISNYSKSSDDSSVNIEKKISPYDELNKLVGLNSVKNEINKMIRMVEFNNKRMDMGLSPEENSLHCVFLGNPGTGKTTVARLIGEILFESKALFDKEKFIFIEAGESDLISSNVGQTAEQTYNLLEKAKGGILFIDEAYTLNKGDSSVNFGQEAINTILKYMEDHRSEIMIIFAGYTKEMEQFLDTNPGLSSRVANKFIFEDYTSDEIVQIGESILLGKQYVIADKDYYEKSVKFAYDQSIDKSNARWIRNFNEKLLKIFASRVIESGSTDLTTITNEDIDQVLNIGKYQNYDGKDEDAYENLQNLIGIKEVKRQIDEFVSMAELNKKRRDLGQKNQNFTLHSLFLGNPGTGKTTVARILGNILFQKSIIKENKFIEVSRSDLVAGYIGQTAIKTREVLKSALGGVLFIDEAYSLSQGTSNDFGNEAIDEILKFMEDYRDSILIIFAGYSKEMKDFINTNSGLESRVPNKFYFEDYKVEELVEIGLLSLAKFEYKIDKDLYYQVVENNYKKSNDHSNGRWIRNFNEKLIRIMSQRVSNDSYADLNTITKEDLELIRQ